MRWRRRGYLELVVGCLFCVCVTRSSTFDVETWFHRDCPCRRERGGPVVVLTRFMQQQGRLAALVSARLEELLAVTVPSMIAQRDQCFVWLILTDADLLEDAKKRIEARLANHGHMRLVASDWNGRDFGHPNFELFERSFGTEAWRATMLRSDRLSLVVLDSDDALNVGYVEELKKWRTNATLLTPGLKTSQWSCSSAKALGWHSAKRTPTKGAEMRVSSERLPHGCIMSGLTLTHLVVNGTATPTSSNNNHMRMRKPPISAVDFNLLVFRIRSVTSNGGKHPPHLATLSKLNSLETAANFGLSLDALVNLSAYLDAHEPAVADEMLRHPEAQGCPGNASSSSSGYVGSCAKKGLVKYAHAVLKRDAAKSTNATPNTNTN